MAQIFTGGRSVFFFCWKFFTCKSGMPPYQHFQEQGTVTPPVSGTGSLAARRTTLPESPRPRMCVGRLATYVRTCHELESAVSSFFGSSSAWSFSTMMWKKTWRRFLLLRQVSAKRVIERLVIFKCNPQHREQCGILVHVQKTSSAKRLLFRGEVDRYWHHRRRETAD